MKLFYAGSFDPFTIGHAHITERALALGADVIIGIGVNPDKKTHMFPVDVRLKCINDYFSSRFPDRVTVVSYEGFTADAARANNADALLRGVRSLVDFSQEESLAQVNRRVFGIDTVILMSDPMFSHVSSSLFRELYKKGSHEAASLSISGFIL